MWIPYEIKHKHSEDFIVKYRLYKVEEGGRKQTFQGYRCDFAYDGDDISKTGIYMIHPEFEDEKGNVIKDENEPVNLSGTARMWIAFPKMREEIHKHRIKIGTKGYFMEGSRRIGETEVIKVVGLDTNGIIMKIDK
ncbi:hypothetical protein [Oceanirhabdus sp. W0125-5]|uniref:hypothetical protein n=1 Tax=Oceanirhabdus sp. W0125-5 TaxID=2999116 RepID=UPI0022F30586|nr:hypothetical protein [Oceanirhabdus sp. W0125-5]WBW98362.1 hypothetical protein OW730_06230 [Oceanirhabdus sp. W0125-5]